MNAVSGTRTTPSTLAGELLQQGQWAAELTRSALGSRGAGVFFLVAVVLGVA